MSTRSRLETVTNIAVLVAAVFVVVYFAKLSLGSTGSTGEAAGPPIGTRLAQVEGYDWSMHERTLVLALRTDCVYCEASMPFYKRLAATAGEDGAAYGVLSAFPQGKVDVERLQSRVGLHIRAVANADLHALGVSGTPTLILVDRNGTVLRTWIGQLAPPGEREVMEALKSPVGP
jgi:hypothetical protein